MQVCTSLQTDNHANTSPLSFLQARCPSCRPTNSIKALKAIQSTEQYNDNQLKKTKRKQKITGKTKVHKSEFSVADSDMTVLWDSYHTAHQQSQLGDPIPQPMITKLVLSLQTTIFTHFFLRGVLSTLSCRKPISFVC